MAIDNEFFECIPKTNKRMTRQCDKRIMMISLHGYVSADSEFGKPDTGGQVVYVLELSRHLASLGYCVDIFTRRFEDQPTIELLSTRVQLFRFPCGGPDFIPKEILYKHIPEWLVNVKNFINSSKLRYCLINSHYWDAGMAGQAIAKWHSTCHFHTPHSIGVWKRDNIDGNADELERKYNFRRRIQAEKYIYDKCDLVIATTQLQYNILKKGEYDTPEKKIRIIPPGYDDNVFYPVPLITRKALKAKLYLDNLIVLALGRIDESKGYDLLIRAMPTVLNRVKNVRLMLAIGSKAPNNNEILQIKFLNKLASDLGISQNVRFCGYIPTERLADYYRAADVFVLSSRYEPFGMTAIEAMASGTPTVITTKGGLRGLFNLGCETIYSDPSAHEDFGCAIASVLEHSDVRNRLRKYGYNAVHTRFSWPIITKQFSKLIEGRHVRSDYRIGITRKSTQRLSFNLIDSHPLAI